MAVTPIRDRGSRRHMLDLVSSPDVENITNRLLKGS